jgi:DNA-binding HxlR family transcriptional regulator
VYDRGVPTSAPRSYDQLCGIATALDVVGDRWALLIVRDLMLGPLRFGDLVDGLPGAGTNTLTLRLKQLESSGVIARRLLPAPDRATVYELTAYGRELEPILMALGRWGTRSMGRLPSVPAARSRWLVAGMLAFHDGTRRVARPTTWELRLSDGPFTLRAAGDDVTMTAGAPDTADHTVTVADGDLHALLTGRITPADAVAAGRCAVSDAAALPDLLSLFAFPPVG